MKFKMVSLFLFYQLGWAQTPPPAETLNTTEELNFDMSPQIDYVYDPTGKKSPFKPYRAPRIKGDSKPATRQDPLTVIDVAQLRLVAVMWNTPKPRAVVKDSQGRSYMIFKNMHIGRNEGIVADIREGEIVIVEKFDDGFGNTVREARILEMKPVSE